MRERLGHKFLIIQVVLLFIMFLLAIGISLLVYLLINKYNLNINNLPMMNRKEVRQEKAK